MRTTFTRIATAVIMTMILATPVLAGSLYTDNGSLLVVSFFGFCALLIAVIPDEAKVRSNDDGRDG